MLSVLRGLLHGDMLGVCCAFSASKCSVACNGTMSRFCQELPVHALDGLETPVLHVTFEEGLVLSV